jgi:HAD superfamily hydrolase (TIGR01549 family)
LNIVSLPLKYEAWLVDLDGTLYSQRPVRLAMACELACFGLPALRVIRKFRQLHEEMRQSQASSPNLHPSEIRPYDEQLARTSEELKIPLAGVSRTIEVWMHSRPGKWLWIFRRRRLLKEIKEFRAAGGRTAIVSDYPATTKLTALRAASLFDVVVANGESGGPSQLKPSPQGYLLAAERLGVLPKNCLVIGDRDDADGLAAKQAGMAFRKV